jgi:hypothetical protein
VPVETIPSKTFDRAEHLRIGFRFVDLARGEVVVALIGEAVALGLGGETRG